MRSAVNVWVLFVRHITQTSIDLHLVIWFLDKGGRKLPVKTLDTIGNCQRPVFSLGVSQHMHKITNLWKFELNRSSELRDKIERKKDTLVTRSCVHLDGWFRDLKILNLRSRNQIRGKLLLSVTLWVSRFSQCFIPSTSSHYSSPSKVLC